MSKKNEVALVKNEKDVVAQVAGQLVGDIEYKTLDAAIENLGKHTGELTPEERLSATNVVSTFEDRVVTQLNNKYTKLDHFLDMLNISPTADYNYGISNFMKDKDIILQVLSDDRYNESFIGDFQKLSEEYEDISSYVEENTPEEPLLDPQYMTPIDYAQKKMEYRTRVGRFNTAVNKKQFTFRKHFMAFKSKLNKNATFKNFLKSLRAQLADTEEAQNIVREKVSTAKMNIMIASSDVRKILLDMHTWAQKLN